MHWSAEQDAFIIGLRREGLSASQIGKQMAPVKSRHSVIGRLARLGEAVPSPPTSPGLRPGPLARAAQPTKAAVVAGAPAPRAFYINQGNVRERVPDKPLPVLREVPLAATVGIFGLTHRSCRWPVGDPQAQDFGFCGRQHVLGSPYCEAHRQASIGAKLKTSPGELIRSCRRFA